MIKPRPALFKWRHFEPEIIVCAVRWYLRFSLSYPNTGKPPVHFPLRRAADCLSRVLSLMISRSNWANERSTFRVNRSIGL
jgi:hypothetical protein